MPNYAGRVAEVMIFIIPANDYCQRPGVAQPLLLPDLNIISMFKINYTTAEEAVKVVKSGDRVFIHGSAATPVSLVKALQGRHRELRQVELVNITLMGDLDFDNELWR